MLNWEMSILGPQLKKKIKWDLNHLVSLYKRLC